MPFGNSGAWLIKEDIYIWDIFKAINIVNIRNTRNLNRRNER
jgi:hypothetical protein